MDLNQFMLALRARRKAFAIALLTTIVTAVAVALIVPKRYVGTATLLLDARDEQAMSPARLSPRERANYVQTQVELITSNRVATQVARDLKIAQRPSWREEWESDTGGIGQIDEWIGAQLIDKLKINTSASNLMLVNFSSSDARFAADVANGFAKAYLDTVLQLRTEPTREAASWFEGQLKALRTQVSEAQGRLNAYQKQKRILVEDARLDVESTRLAELSTQLLAARNATYDAVSRHKQATELLESGASPEAIPDVLANAHIVALKTGLGAVEARRAQESTMLGENHPQYLRTSAEVQGLREKLKAEMKKLVASEIREDAKKYGDARRTMLEEAERVVFERQGRYGTTSFYITG